MTVSLAYPLQGKGQNLNIRQILNKQSVNDFIRALLHRSTAAFLIKAVALFTLLFFVGISVPYVPAPVFALYWVLLTAVLSVGSIYFAVVRKSSNQIACLEPGGRLAERNNGRTFSTIVGFIFASIGAGSVLIAIPKWDVSSWGIIAAAIVLFLLVSCAVSRLAKKELKPLFRVSGTVQFTALVVGILLGIIIVLSYICFPSTNFDTTLGVYENLNRAFADSPSPLLVDIERIAVASDAMLLHANPDPGNFAAWLLFLIMKIIVGLSIVFSALNLLTLCYLNKAELERVFTALPSEQTLNAKRSLHKGVIWGLALLSALSFALFMVGNEYCADTVEAGKKTVFEQFAYESLNVFAFAVDDGKSLDAQMTGRVISDVDEMIRGLSPSENEG